MRTIELFAGIGGFRLAAEECGVETVWANDICAKACKVYESIFGAGEIHHGDIRLLADAIPRHDLLTGGFPCQPFSSAGKKKGIRDPRGTLFEVIVELLERHRPKYFIIENVKRLLTMESGFHFATILSSLADLDYQIEWRLLNALHFGLPQNRQRVFLIGNRRGKRLVERRRSPPIRLASVIDLARLPWRTSDHLADTSKWIAIGDHGARFPNWGLAFDGCFCGADLESFSEGSEPTFLKSVLQDSPSDEFDFTDVTKQWLKDNKPVNRFVHGVEILSNQGGGARMGYTIFGINGVAPTLTSTTSRHYERYKIGNRYRRLTNVEYARIQGFPDDHCDAVSVYDQYALFGNAVPPPMVKWVMQRVHTPGINYSLQGEKQLGLF